MREMKLTIRPADESDVVAIAALSAELGYPVDRSDLRTRLESRDAGEVFVASDEERRALGFIVVSARNRFVSGYRAEIEALVVTERQRSSGVGSRLLARAERWATEQGCPEVMLFSNVVRERAHGFYLREGYHIRKSEHFFEKQL
jgi:GNAT superfamily N-acetyltransferase